MIDLLNHASGVFTDAKFLAAQPTMFRHYFRFMQATAISLVLVLVSAGFKSTISAMVAVDPHKTGDTSVDFGDVNIQTISAPSAAVTKAEKVKTFSELKKKSTGVVLSNNDLQAIVAAWQKRNPGMQAGVLVQELGGSRRAVSVNGDKQFFAASIYKLFVVQYLYERIQQGSLDPNATMGTSKTVSQCIEAMIVVSDNACPEGVAATVGWATLHNFARSKGFANTSLAGGNIKVSAADANSWMAQLQSGTLLSAGHTEQLLGYMKKQIYRKAIPAGSQGAVVANKVGFYGASWHDSGLVYGPKGTYAITVLTTGAGPSQIADLAKDIARFLNA